MHPGNKRQSGGKLLISCGNICPPSKTILDVDIRVEVALDLVLFGPADYHVEIATGVRNIHRGQRLTLSLVPFPDNQTAQWKGQVGS